MTERDEASPTVELKHSTIHLQVRPRASNEKKEAILEEWYRGQLKKAVPSLIAKWEPLIGVRWNDSLRKE
jgi:hypothetical protein